MIIIVLLVVGYIVLRKIAADVFAMFLAGTFDYDISGKVMVVYPMHDLPWYRPDRLSSGVLVTRITGSMPC